MKAIVTGASSGIGEQFAKQLSARGYDIVLVARRGDRLRKLAAELPTHTTVIEADLSTAEGCDAVCAVTDVDLLVNNAGFGSVCEFASTDIDKDMLMIDVNIKALHRLTHHFIGEFIARGGGSVLNVASVAGFAPGPLMSTYYATKGYVVRLTQGIREELRRLHPRVKISALCPGPVATEFNDVADAAFGVKGMSAQKVVSYAIKKHFKGKTIITPGILIKFLRVLQSILPASLMARLSWNFQSNKTG